MDDRVGALESIVNLMTPDNGSLKLKVSHWETASKAVSSGFLASWWIYTGRRGGACVVLNSAKLKLLLRRGSLGLTHWYF